MGLEGESHLYSQAKPGVASGTVHPNPSSAQRCRWQGLTCWPPAKMALGEKAGSCLPELTHYTSVGEGSGQYVQMFL